VKKTKVTERKRLKARIPKLVRQEAWRYKRVKSSWRRPTGVSNKMRRRQRGWPKMASIGYKTPENLRHLHPSGLREVLVYRAPDLDKLDAKTCVARIGHTVGEKKRVAILDRARELEVKVLNPRVSRREEAVGAEEPITEAPEPPKGQTQAETSKQQTQEEKEQ